MKERICWIDVAKFFGILSILVFVIMNNATLDVAVAELKVLVKGAIRNQFFALGLWFLTCLFVIEVAFALIKKIKSKPLILGVCFICYFIAQNVMNPRPIQEPHWIYNIDSAFYYIIVYAIGYVSFDYIDKILNSKTKVCQIIVLVSGGACVVYMALLFFGKDFLSFLESIELVGTLLYQCLCPLITIWAVFLFSYLYTNSQKVL